MPNISKILSKGLKWWSNRVSKRDFIAVRSDFPSDYFKTFLIKKGLIGKIKNDLYLLKNPEDNLKDQVLLLYFKIIKKILSKYNSWSIRGTSALDIYLGNQKVPRTLKVRTSRKVKYTFKLPGDLVISIAHDPNFDKNLVQSVNHSGEELYVDIPERILVDIKKIGSKEKQFIKSQKFDYRLMEIMYQNKPVPVIFQKLCRILPDLGQQELAERLKIIMDRYTFYRSVKIELPDEKISHEILGKEPWVIRQFDQISCFNEILEKKFGNKIKRFPTSSLSPLLKEAEKNKQYDIYHSTTIEGYHITPEDVSRALLSPKIDKKKEENLRNKMAILGYRDAFDFVLKKVKKDFSKTKVDEDLVKDIFLNLFRPSVELKIVDGYNLTRYRSIQNFIRGSRHIPPSPDKVNDLMRDFGASLDQIKNPVILAILAHFLFASIHPYIDGNGRTARLLMNYIFLSSGYHWITIKAEDRQEYFAVLQTAQVDDDILPFAKFIIDRLPR